MNASTLALLATDIVSQPVTLGAAAGIAAVASSLIAVGSFVHAKIVVPNIMREVSAEVEKKIDAHSKAGPHPGSVPRETFELLMRSLETRMSRMEMKIDELTEALTALAKETARR